jgi:transmembrane 9 superfamily protein 2/4
VNSVKTQFPFSYYYLPVCGQNSYSTEAENLGEILTGDYTYSTQYEIKMKNNEFCKLLCVRKINTEYEENLFSWLIERDYVSHWFLDNLPAGLNYTYRSGTHSDRVIYDHGIPIGINHGIDSQNIIYNHFTFIIFVNADRKSQKPYSIVEFTMIPWSINHNIHKDGNLTTLCAKNEHEFKSRHNWQEENYLKPKQGEDIAYTYDVIFYDSTMKWTSRWDHYMLSNQDDNIHWFSFMNSTLIILIFTALLAHIFCRALKRDIEYINTVNTNITYSI